MSDASAIEAPPGTEPAEQSGPADPSHPSSFDAFPIGPQLLQALGDMGYAKPTAVQAAVITSGVAGKDLLVQSKTGSGKTTAFGIPMLERLPSQGGAAHQPLGLVLLPTRELAHQVAAELRLLAQHKGTRVQAVYGGVPMGRQTTALTSGVDIIVGTPGRLLDHIRRKNLTLEALQCVVLDEADEMLSMGFWDDVTELLKMSPKTRQTMLFSATLPYEVAKAAASFLSEPVRIDLSGDDLTVSNIDNYICNVLPDLPKPRQMLYLLETAKPHSAIIFCNTRNETEMLAKFLTQSGFEAEPLSGNLKQKDRERVMGRIKCGELRYMVATDIAARGIDINDLKHVFMYSLPEFSEVYLHRAGRTGRIGKAGTAISLVDGRGLGTLTQLERAFGIKFGTVVLPPEDEIIRARSVRIMKELADKASVAEVGQQMAVAQEILGNADATKIVAFLLKTYFNNKAEVARRDPAPARTDESEPQQAALGTETAEAGEAGEAGEDGEGARRRRRRRRGRGRGTGSERAAGEGTSNERSAGGRSERSVGERSSPERGERTSGGERRPHRKMDIVNAADLLADDEAAMPTNTGAPVAPASRAAVSTATAQPRGAERPSERPPVERAVERPVERSGESPEAAADGLTRIRVNIGFDDGFKGRGAVAKKISALAGLNEGIVTEVESRRDHAVLKATPEIAEMVIERVDGAQLGKKVISVNLAN